MTLATTRYWFIVDLRTSAKAESVEILGSHYSNGEEGEKEWELLNERSWSGSPNFLSRSVSKLG